MLSTLTGNSAGPVTGYIAQCSTVSPQLQVLSRRKNAIAPSLLPALPSAPNYGMIWSAWSSSANYLAAYGNGAGVFYKRSGSTFTKSSLSTVAGETNVATCAISQDGNYVAYASGKSTSYIFHNNNGTLTQLSIGTAIDRARAVAVSSDGQYVAFLATFNNNNPKLIIKVRSGSGSTATYSNMTMTAPGSPGHNSAGTSGAAFSPDNNYLVVVGTDWTVYKFDSSTGLYGAYSGFSTTKTGFFSSCCFSSDGEMLAIVEHSSRRESYIYTRSGDTFTLAATLTGPNTNSHRGQASFDPTGQYYVTGNGDLFKKGTTASSWTYVSTIRGSVISNVFSPLI